MHRVELKGKKEWIFSLFKRMFLMHRVELKVEIDNGVQF